MEKVFYLDIPVEERTVIDQSFEIRDLVYSKKMNVQYLVLLLSASSSKTYLGNCSKFLLIKTNIPETAEAYERDLPEKVSHFSDPIKNKEIELHRFLHHMDEGLGLILKAYPLPVFVLGAERDLGHFKKITRHEKSIIRYIHGNYEESSETEIREAMKPYISDWKHVKQQEALQKLDQASSEKRLACGINEVWASASRKNGQLLVVEKDFMYPASRGTNPDTIFRAELSSTNPFYIKDAVDDVIEKVLECGGEIEFVDNGVLRAYGHIALIQYHSSPMDENYHFM